MFGDALLIGIIVMFSALGVIGVVVGVLHWKSRANDRVTPRTVPPPVDPGMPHPEKARDVNADERERRKRDS